MNCGDPATGEVRVRQRFAAKVHEAQQARGRNARGTKVRVQHERQWSRHHKHRHTRNEAEDAKAHTRSAVQRPPAAMPIPR